MGIFEATISATHFVRHERANLTWTAFNLVKPRSNPEEHLTGST